MWAVFINNASEIVLGLVYTAVIFSAGTKFGKWRAKSA